MRSPTDDWNGSEVLAFFGRHLVALCLTYRLSSEPTESEPIFRAYAGTLIRIRNTVSFLTAGHIVREIEEALRSNQVQIQGVVLADTFGWHRVTDHPIPFDLDGAPRFYRDSEQEGLDFGLIALRPYYVRLLAANRMVALREENWVHQSGINFDGYLMLGLPTEFSSDHLPASGEALVSPTMFRVQRLELPPESTPRHPRFVGSVDRELSLTSMVGMSGGPIFGFNFAPPSRYWIVALQSSWIRERRIVFGCPIPIMASLLTEWTDRLLSAGGYEVDDSSTV